MKQKFKKIIQLLLVVIIVFIAYFIFKACTVENQKIIIKYCSNVSANTNLEAIVGVVDKNNNTKKSNITLELYNHKTGKKVKGVKEKYKLNEGEMATCELEIPENIEDGNYDLHVKAKSGLLTTKKEVTLSISNSSNSDILISLDKGIYKPGDKIKYRALLISKTDNTPQTDKEVLVEILDGNGNRVYSEKSNTTDFGIVSGNFELASEVNSGEYTISVSSNSKKIIHKFTVNPYVTPQFEVAITTEKDVYLVGETANIIVNAKYFFGEPVVNATISGKVDDKEISGITDNEGNFVLPFEMQDKGEKDIQISVTDTSNYLIESTKKIYAQEYAFEVETIFENGLINKNTDNNVYLFAKKIDGTPVKIHATVNIGNIARQVVTDESGIGKFVITSSDAYNLNSKDNLTLIANDSDNNEFTAKIPVTVASNSVTLSTDKVKYNQGEDININLKCITDDREKTIYICKNNETIKMISTDEDNVIINLEDTSGLIDIFVKGTSIKNYNYYNTVYDDIDYDADYRESDTYFSNNSDYIRKTIFIKPVKALNIDISTDKEVYKPGENLNLTFTVKDENNKGVDTNLLVSILDEAILSLADNDLSIDNIRLALKDIELSDDISSEDLYAEILDNKSESKLMLALLKSNSDDPNIVEDTSLEKYSDDYVELITILVFVSVVAIAILISLSNSKRAKSILIDLLNVCSIVFLVSAIVMEETYYDLFDFSDISIFIVIGIVTFIIYALVLYKVRNKIFDLLKQLVFMPGIYYLILFVLYNILDYSGYVLIIGTLVVPILMTILVILSRNSKLNKIWETIKNYTIKLSMAELSYFIAAILAEMTFENTISLIVFVILIYLSLEKIYNVKILKEKSKTRKLSLEFNTTDFLITAVVVIIAIMIFKNYSDSRHNYYDYDDFSATRKSTSLDSTDVLDFYPSEADSGASSGISFDFSKADSFFNNISKNDTTQDISETEETIQNETFQPNNENAKQYDEEIETVRNVFLESLAFIPDLLAENGNANTEIKLSDNITTWNIQVVGNTKSGNFGSATKNFKVFKEFFIDFSLPANSVVTDKTSIPVTIYNYKDTPLTVSLNVVNNDWSNISDYPNFVEIESNSTKLVYIPIEILKQGDNVFRIEATANNISDIVEKTFTVTPNGYKKSKVISSSTIEESFTTDYFATETALENTRKLKLKVYPTAISQAIEGMDAIFKLPTGCFEQTSSSLYPNILALKYLEDNNLDNQEIREKALDYISKGYQRILTFEVKGEKGGYSLYGDDPAEPVITAFGLMELNDAKEVYDIDEQVIQSMKDYLYRVQKSNGSFDIGSTYIGSAGSETDLAMNAYIIWALSEVDSQDNRLNLSIEYLENKLDKVEDNYTLALIANAFTNVNNKKATKILNKLMENIIETDDTAYIDSKIKDYYGSYGSSQAIQTTALTSMALSKNNLHSTTNNSFIRYLISKKDSYGNWGTTQASILALKAINLENKKGKIAGQTISVTINNETKDIKVGDTALDIYELEFDNIENESKISINMKKGSITYELIEEYYVPYENIDNKESNGIEITEQITTSAKVNDIITQEVSLKNTSSETISNGLISINIPQGCTVDQNYLEMCKTFGEIEKYEYNYTTLNIYIRDFDIGETKNLKIQYRANYPEQVTGGTVRAFDYYNPSIEGINSPSQITISE